MHNEPDESESPLAESPDVVVGVAMVVVAVVVFAVDAQIHLRICERAHG